MNKLTARKAMVQSRENNNAVIAQIDWIIEKFGDQLTEDEVVALKNSQSHLNGVSAFLLNISSKI
ncbi:hypothetical protein [Paenibacillus sp. NAIST15-1]|uniref:hypothetical protein n=1 Tax=Paenibacillus sp. NAIST15-1 TaxID=1605994 RepID=UPI00086A7B76|nr:hypothetical protein [Paenibacillus sp. NAIST15-1]GAV16092.1 hypothetical protein PBN151_6077 [Paenibacillus sp. NAIST15-1]